MATVSQPHLADTDARREDGSPVRDLPGDLHPAGRRLRWQAVPAWLVSTLVHVVILLSLAMVTLPEPVQVVNVLSATTDEQDAPEIEQFTVEEIDLGQSAQPEQLRESVAEVSEAVESFEPAPVEMPSELATVPLEISDVAAEMAPSDASLQTLAALQPQAMSGRTSSDTKKRLLRDYGGNASSEAAVTEALKWLARHQMPNGGWTFHHPLVCGGQCGTPGDLARRESFNAATALALLPFMGAGQTHYEGQYKNVVRGGLLFLIRNGKAGKRAGMPVLDFSENGGNMYSHGLAAIALCEAYAMTEDPALAGPSQAALNYIVFAQGRDGGWRYQPQAPDGGDTSVTGWQVMALKSGHMGHLVVPPATIRGATLFLDKVQTLNGAAYGYTSPSSDRPSCTAIGLLCRMYTGWGKNHPGVRGGVEVLAKTGVDKKDIYYNYYAAQVLRHYGGSQWQTFNQELRDWLVESQAEQGEANGSWHFPNSRAHRGPQEGGRLASTALATMILEVYYRHMPLYAESAAEDEFPL